ncbi:MAG: hypothetical protein ACR652_07635 [Methylocystis sp.]|uniref:hypothetical protein n=1 Tax=Methylocystis sp. TaxID=1911079 RepID=UPI003DA1E1E5
MRKPTKNVQTSRGMAATVQEAEKTQAEFGAMCAMSRQRVSRFVREGAIPTNAEGKIPHPAGLQALIEHLSQTAAGRGGGSAQADLAKERAALARAQREAVELKTRSLLGEYVLAKDVERKWGDMCFLIRNRLLAIPSQIPFDIPHLTRAELEIFDRYIRDALTEIADDLDAQAKEKSND